MITAMIILTILLATAWGIYWTYHSCWIAAKQIERSKFMFSLVLSPFGIPEIIYVRKKQKL